MKVSIILPVYNVEYYLPLCLASIRSQTYRNFEVVCVDDGSTDRSLEILKMCADVDKRFRVYSQSNSGVSAARNKGFDLSTGDVVWFVDPDDLIVKDALKSIVQAFESTGADVVTFGGEVYPYSRGDNWLINAISPRDTVYRAFDISIFTKEASEPYAWRTACKAAFLRKHGIHFNTDLSLGEDKVFQYAVYPRSSVTAFLSAKLYKYRVGREDSQMSNLFTDDHYRLYSHLRIFKTIVQDWQDGRLLPEHGVDLLLLGCDFLLVDILSSPKEWRTDLLNYLGAIWTTYFTEDQLQELYKNKQYGNLCTSVLECRKKAFGISYKLMFYAYSFANSPRDFFLRFARRIRNIGIIKRITAPIINRLPLSRHSALTIAGDMQSQEQDYANCIQALNLLRLEWDSKMGDLSSHIASE